jgi:hypothetical protein
VCEVDERPFQLPVYGGNNAVSVEDVILMAALRSLSKDQPIFMPIQ